MNIGTTPRFQRILSIMFRNRNNLFGIICCFLLLSCSNQKNNDSFSNPTIKNSENQLVFEWEELIDHRQIYLFESTEIIDSLVLYFLKEDAPSVYDKNMFIIWKNGQVTKTDLIGEFDLYYRISDNHFVFFYIENQLHCQELKINDQLQTQQTNLYTPKEQELKIVSIDVKEGDSLFQIRLNLYNDLFNKSYSDSVQYNLVLH